MDASLIPRLPLSGFPVSRVALDQPHQGSPEGKESVSLLKVLLILVTAEGCGLCPAGPLLLSTLRLSLSRRTDLEAGRLPSTRPTQEQLPLSPSCGRLTLGRYPPSLSLL